MRIALVSDTHLSARVANFAANWQATRAWLAETAPDLIIHLGDISRDGAADAAELATAWDQFRTLGPPIRFLPGNHDIGDNPIAPDRASAHPLDFARLAEYRLLFGPDWWSLDVEGWQLVGLNAQLLGTGSAEEAAQFAWLEATLACARGPLGLLLHKPLFRDRPEESEPHIRYVPREPRQRLLGLLAGRDLRFVAAGHTHQHRQHRVDGIDHVWVPSATFRIADAMQETVGRKVVGAMLLELGAAGHRFNLETPPALMQLDLLDHPEAYPEVAAFRAAQHEI